MVGAAQFLCPAPDNLVPSGWTPPAQRGVSIGSNLSLEEALRTPHWYLLWSMLALNVTAGAALISVAAPLARELTGVGPALGALSVSVIALFNGIGRLFWGTLSDRLGRARTFLMIFLLQIPAFALMTETHNFLVLLLPVAIVALCYGGGFGTMPAFTTDVFGPKNSGTIYGVMLTAWSAGAIVGPLFIAAVSYDTALPLIAGLLSVAAMVAMVFPVVSRICNRSLARSAS